MKDLGLQKRIVMTWTSSIRGLLLMLIENGLNELSILMSMKNGI